MFISDKTNLNFKKKLSPVESKANNTNNVDQDLDKKIEQLQIENTKLNYRILHLTNNIKERLDNPVKMINPIARNI
jgi:peptidoglycan hydrolase CwlO-like protein